MNQNIFKPAFAWSELKVTQYPNLCIRVRGGGGGSSDTSLTWVQVVNAAVSPQTDVSLINARQWMHYKSWLLNSTMVLMFLQTWNFHSLKMTEVCQQLYRRLSRHVATGTNGTQHWGIQLLYGLKVTICHHSLLLLTLNSVLTDLHLLHWRPITATHQSELTSLS